ncbi:MAG: hypothetical protein RMK51_07930 [Meiothermus sp.]|uniref:hypothetical protein n=1 Tax=Meiothermus sp. TaxID=1955249 RepID=UPI00298EDF5E|nr:hypothetical protein [Meiothermus sp.]MDW8425848.1 hypothetical protein [Meiothermus sp.]
MKRWYAGALLLVGLLGCNPSTPPTGGITTPIKATEGGTVENGGARLVIPPGALSQDATVTLSLAAKPSEPSENPLKPAGPAVSFDLGGATLQQAATLELPTDVAGQEGDLVILEKNPTPGPDEPQIRVHAARPVGGAQVSGQSLASKVAYSVTRKASYVAYLVPKPKPQEGVAGRPLQVPFYWQAYIPWCVPTSLAMVLNYHQALPAIAGSTKFPGGFASNFGLASLIKQPASSGSNVVSILKAAGVPDSAYSTMQWDADLIPSNPFSAYIVLATTGVFGLFPAKPVWTSSDRQWHGFVISGLTNAAGDGIFLHDSNFRWGGAPNQVTWAQFREQNCKLKDEKDPSKGCSGDKELDGLYTLIFYNDPKPETQRRGSIELSRDPSSLTFRNPSNELISRWDWEGGYPNGYYFTDEATRLSTFPYGSNLVQDAEFRSLIYRSSRLEVGFNVVNVTNVALDFEIEARLYVNNAMKSQKLVNTNVAAYDDSPINLDFGNLADLAGTIGSPTPARLELNLRQGGQVQDVKQIAFKLAPNPPTLPTVRILVPSASITLLKGEPFTFRGEGFDPHSLPDGRARLSWLEGGTLLGNGSSYTLTPAAAGTRTVNLVATGEYGLQATASTTFTVIDPTRTPGEIVIVEPKPNAAYWSPTINQALVDVPLVGYATYSNGAAVPGARLVWTAQAQGGSEVEVGRGSSLTVRLAGGRSFALPYTIRLTVLSDAGTPIGSRTVLITVGYTYIG